MRYKVPHSYYTLRYRAKQHGIHLPSKPPRELNIPYKENEIRKLMKQEDPDLFKRVEKEHKSGNLEKMRKEYVVKTEKKIAVKNQEYKKYDHNKKTQSKTNETKKSYNYPANKRIDDKSTQNSKTKYTEEKYNYNKKSQSHITKRPKNGSKSSRKAPPAYYYDDEKKTNKKQGKTKRPNQYDEKKMNKKQGNNTKQKSPDYYEKKEPSPQKSNYKQTSSVQKSSPSNEKKSTDNYRSGAVKRKR